MFFDASHESSDASTNFHHRQQKAVLHNREKLVDILAELLGTICCKACGICNSIICSRLRFLWGVKRTKNPEPTEAKPSETLANKSKSLKLPNCPRDGRRHKQQQGLQPTKHHSFFLSLDSTSLSYSFTNFKLTLM